MTIIYYQIKMYSKYIMQQIPNLGLSVINGLLFVAIIAFCFTIFTYYNVNNVKNEVILKIKKQEDNLTTFDFCLLYLNRFIHIFNFLFVMTTLFVFKPNLFLYMIAFIDILIGSINTEFFKNECPITYLEKRILDNKYILNSTKDYEPYIAIITFKEKKSEFHRIIGFFLRFFIFLFLSIRLYKHFFLPKSNIPEEIRM